MLSHLGYPAWANQQLLDACSALTAEELDGDLQTSHASVAGILRHIYYTERVWLKH